MEGMYGYLRTLRTAAITGIAVLSLVLVPGRPAAAEALGERQLREALLDAVDFPEGWARDSAESAEQRGFGVPRPSEPACEEIFDSAAETVARAGFARTRSGPFVTTVATAHQDAGAARGALTAFEEAVTGECGTLRTRERSGEGVIAVAYDAALIDDAGRLGEESLAVRFQRRVEGQAPTTPVIADLVIARVGAQVVRVAQAGREDGTGGMEQIAERAVEKLQQVTEGRTPAPPPDQPGTTEL